jgi:arylsulfatase A
MNRSSPSPRPSPPLGAREQTAWSRLVDRPRTIERSRRESFAPLGEKVSEGRMRGKPLQAHTFNTPNFAWRKSRSSTAIVSLLTTTFLLIACAGKAEAAANPKPRLPNIIYILADDLGLGDVSCYNSNSAWRTPHLDGLAREGLRFTDAHSASGVCTPSRYALLTGRYPWRGPLKRGVTQGYSPPLIESGRLTVPALLRSNGYHTAMFGKWHLGLAWSRNSTNASDVDFSKPFGGGPTANGFDQFYGISACHP